MDMVWKLNRKKDVVCLILSYPPFNSRNYETHRGWVRDVLEITHKVENEGASFIYPGEITKLLRHSFPDIKALVPFEISFRSFEEFMGFPTEYKTSEKAILDLCIDEHKTSEKAILDLCIDEYKTSEKAILDLCIDDFMIRQILQYIQIPEIRRIWISQVNGKTFLRRLKNLPPIRQMFDLIIQVNVKSCLAVEDTEDRIIEKLGFSKSSRGEAEKLLRSKNFLILLDDFDPRRINWNDLGNGWWNSDNTQKIAFIGFSGSRVSGVWTWERREIHPMDLEIRRFHHLLSWQLFCWNVGEVVHSSSIQQLAIHVLRQCSGHLLAVALMARALKGVKDVRIWQHASRLLGFLPTSHAEDRILFNSLAFVLQHLGSANKCVKYCASCLETKGIDKVDLLERWMKEDLIGTLDEGEQIVQHLVNALLLERFPNGESVQMRDEICKELVQNGESVRMRDEIRKELVNFYKAEMNPILLVELDGRGLVEAPKNEAWEEANEMYLMNNKIAKLPDNPNCPKLSVLFLQGNYHLRVISSSFFQYMPILQILDLSQTKIKSLPQSFFKLVQLRKFILRSCELFKELPDEVGELCHLEVLDLEGTEIINLPVTVGKLTNLTNLKVSFYPRANGNRKNNPSNRIIPQNVISRLLQLEELSIDVNPEDERWNATIKDIVKEVCCLNQLHFLKLHLPEVLLLNDLRNGSSLINLSWMQFRFIVGNHLKRIISRLPHESAIKFEEQESCLKYVSGVGIPTEIKEVLQHATAFFLDRHLTATSLSEFGIENMEKLKFCVLQECNEIETIVDANDYRDEDGARDTFESLQYLSLHYMKNLRSIWKVLPGGSGSLIWWGPLYYLKALVLYSCPKLTTIFTRDLVRTLPYLEELVIEDCPEINSIVLLPYEPSWRSLSKLKKISLHYMPKLVSISGGKQIAPNLEWLSFYDCPSLKILSPEEVNSNGLNVIIGEADWWSALKWDESKSLEPRNLDDIFMPIERDIDLRTQLAAINDQLLQAQIQKTEPSQQSGPGDSLKAPAVEAESSSKQKQVA